MLTMIEEILLSEDLLEIINNKESQTASELFYGYNGIPANIINENYQFHFIARNKNDLKILLTFFNKFILTDNQIIRLKINDISIDELDNIINEFKGSNVVNRLWIDISFDKSCDFININELDHLRLIINDVKKTIPKNATNLEIITYVYNWLKKREYKHNSDEPILSKLYSTSLLTEYIVCVGFSKVFNNILSEYGIRASEYQHHLLIDGKEIGHDISIVKVQDEKYGVDGLYFFDLTRDSYTPNNKNDYKYSGFMMTYDDVAKDIITKDMFNKMLFLDRKDIQDTIDILKPEVTKLTIDDDKEDFTENIPEEIVQLIFNLMQIDIDLFYNEKTVDMFCLNDPNGSMYYIYRYILFLIDRLGNKVEDSTIIDLLINTVNTDNIGYYLAAINTYSPNDDYNSQILDKHHQYIKKRLGTMR